MSFLRIILVFSSIVSLFSNCQDKESKKNNPNIETHTDTTAAGIDKVTIPNSEEKKIKKIDLKKPLSDTTLFKIANTNLYEFMVDYGKNNPETIVRLETKYGSIDIQLYQETPIHRANFIYLVKQKYFDETFFYRVAKGFVIQGGNSDRNEMAQKRFEIGDYTIPQEPVSHLKHVRGAVALSKQWVDNPSNRSTPYEFFIVVAKKGAPHLDGEHTIFGKVIKGMNVVDQISNVPVDASEWPKENIFIQARAIR